MSPFLRHKMFAEQRQKRYPLFTRRGQKLFTKRTKIFPDLDFVEFRQIDIIMLGVCISSVYFPTRCLKKIQSRTQARILGCFRFALFLSFVLCFFILCTNVMKSCQKKIGLDRRSFDPPPRLTRILLQKFNENVQEKLKNSKIAHLGLTLAAFFSLSEFLGWV